MISNQDYHNRILLSITIPTYNRVNYLVDLLQILKKQLARKALTSSIELIISDNASTDNTQDYIKSLNFPGLKYLRNKKNIGAAANFIECVKKSKGEYVWILGDDELLEEGAIDHIYEQIKKEKYSLLVLSAIDQKKCDLNNQTEFKNYGEIDQKKCDLNNQTEFKNYGELINTIAKRTPGFILEHTLVSVNIFRRSIFNIAYSKKKISSAYNHMLGFIPQLVKGGRIYIYPRPVIKVREIRAPFHDDLASFLMIRQGLYLLHLAKLFNNYHLRKYGISWIIGSIKGVPVSEFLRIGRKVKHIIMNTLKRN